MVLDRYDLIVVGCGPAGSTAARIAADRGVSVMIVDRRRSVGMPPRCAGYVPKWLRERTGFDDGAVLQEVKGIRLVSPEGSEEIDAPGFVLDRARFDKTLAIHALESGADLANAIVLRRDGEGVVLRRNGIQARFVGKVILGSDGPGSVIGRSIGQSNRTFMAAMQYEVGMRVEDAWSELHRPIEGREGHAWFVPCGRTARVGVGLPRLQAKHLKQYLNRFLRRLAAEGRIYTEGILGCTGGLVPINGRLETAQSGGVLLAGAAGGMCDPFNGAGIASAVIGGEVVGRIVGDALQGEDPLILRDYDTEIGRKIPLGEWGQSADFGLMTERMYEIAAWRGQQPSKS